MTSRSNSNPIRKPSNLLKNETLVQQESQYGHNLNYEALGDYEPVQDRASYMSMTFERSLARSFKEHEQTRGDAIVSDISRGSRRRQSSVESLNLEELSEEDYLDETQVEKVVSLLKSKGVTVVEMESKHVVKSSSKDDGEQQQGEERFCMLRHLLRGAIVWN
ncbi:hypothetical protein HDU77_005280 [Chytriomyces hyalinus]|nr:hypothetical protein HDU77_005280 [Chytriomyces hyalinus]